MKMVYLKIILYGILAFVERHPLFTTFLVLTAIFAPIVWKAIGWVVLGIIILLLLVVGGMALRVHSMRRKMDEQMRSGGAGFSGFDAGGFNTGGFSAGGFNAQGMTLEELVRRMQEQADAQRRAQGGKTTTTTSSTKQQKRVNDKVGDYVDFEEVE